MDDELVEFSHAGEIISCLADAAHKFEVQHSSTDSTCCEAGWVFGAALRRLGAPVRSRLRVLGRWPTALDIIDALVIINGGFRQTGCEWPTDFLAWTVAATRSNHHRWVDGEHELSQRTGLFWQLRNWGVWPMPKLSRA